MIELSDILGEKVSAFWGKQNVEVNHADLRIEYDEIVITLEEHFCRIHPVTSTDEVQSEFGLLDGLILDGAHAEIPRFNNFLGSTFSEYWVSSNSRGYSDMTVFGFHRLHPSILILSEGTVLKIFVISEIPG